MSSAVMHTRSAIIAILLIAATAGHHFSAHAAGGKMSQAYLDAFRETMKQILLADAGLLEQMEYTQKRLDNYYRKFGHFPRPGVQEDNFKAAVLKRFAFNPYKPQVHDLYYNKPLPEEGRSHLYILTDSGLSMENIRHFTKNPPPSWQAEPGSIMIMTNGENLYLIWGAGADRLPMRDHRTEDRVRLLYRDFSAEPQVLTGR